MDTVEKALADLAAGLPVVVADGEHRENEGDLIAAADRITAATMAFLVRHTSGYVCVALPGPDCERLSLPPMHHGNDDRFGTAYRVTVDAAAGIGTGISARDRATTARLLASGSTEANDLTRPGHVVPLRARAGGVLARAGHTEAAVDLTRLAGLRPAGVLAEIVSAHEPTRMARRPELAEFAREHGLTMITIEDLAAYRQAAETSVERVTSTRLPTASGLLETVGYRGVPDGSEHIALVAGDVRGQDVPVHVHVECVLGDVFGAPHCGCARHLDAAVREVTSVRRGVVVYLRPGGSSGLRALLSVGEASRRHACDAHGATDPLMAAAILRDLGVTSIRRVPGSATTCTPLDAAVANVLAARPDADRVAARGAVA